jgi:rhomboid protease GluP
MGANVPARVFDGQVYRLITAAFLHANLTHLLSNILSILIIFSRLEACYSILEVTLLYIVSAVSGNILSDLTSHSPYQVAVGASTAIMGFIGALISYLIINWSSLAVLGSLRRGLTFTIGFLVFSSILYSMIITRSSVDVYGHIGGFIGGLFSSLLIFPPINPRQSLVIKIVGTILITGYLLATFLYFYLLKY